MLNHQHDTDPLAPVRRLVADLRGGVPTATLAADLDAVERWLNSPQPSPLGHGWHATPWDGVVSEVWLYGQDDRYFWIDADGRQLVTVNGELSTATVTSTVRPTKAEAVEAALVVADAQLTRARAAVDRLHAELAAV